MAERVQEITQLLQNWGAGRGVDHERLAELVYGELRAIAAGVMHGRGGTLQPTAVVNEAWLRLQGPGSATDWSGRKHFYAVAAKAMRHVLADHARRHGARKRGGGDAARVTLDPAVAPVAGPSLDLVALDEACTRLTQLDARQGQIVELRFFAGLTIEETAEAMAIAPATVKDEWRVARAWLRRELEGAERDGR